jgi:hypothetical protein
MISTSHPSSDPLLDGRDSDRRYPGGVFPFRESSLSPVCETGTPQAVATGLRFVGTGGASLPPVCEAGTPIGEPVE